DDQPSQPGQQREPALPLGVVPEASEQLLTIAKAQRREIVVLEIVQDAEQDVRQHRRKNSEILEHFAGDRIVVVERRLPRRGEPGNLYLNERSRGGRSTHLSTQSNASIRGLESACATCGSGRRRARASRQRRARSP